MALEQKQIKQPEKRYKLPICGVVLSESALWGSQPGPVLLRPEDLEKLYGIPKGSVYDLVYKSSEMPDPLPFLKLERKTMIPRAALEAWILRQAHVKEVQNDQPTH
jgi:hypothetical protein